MKTEKNTITLLCITALLLLLACIFVPQRSAEAEVTVNTRDYLLCTYPTSTGNDAIYIANTRTDKIAVFVYDSSRKALEPMAIRAISDGFSQKGAGAGVRRP